MKALKQIHIIIATLILVCVFANLSYSYTIKSEHPRIWINNNDLTSGRNLVERTTGSHTKEYSYILTWCNQHINDSMGSISQNSDYNWAGDNNMAIHLLRYSLIYQISKINSYGDRVKSLLYYLASNGNDDFDSSIHSGDGYSISAPAISIGYDWCYDRIKGSMEQSSIENYLSTLVDAASEYCIPGKVTYKTEEPWYGAFIAMAIHAEGIADSKALAILNNFKSWVESYIGHYDASGYMGGAPFGGTYVMLQFPHHFASFAELWRAGTNENWWNLVNGNYTPPIDFSYPGSEFARYFYRKNVLEARPGLLGLKNGDGSLDSYCYTGPMFAEYSWAFAWNYQDPVAKYWGDLIEQINPNYNLVSWTINRTPYNFFKLLWYDNELQGGVQGQSKYNFWRGTNKVTFRNGFDYSITSLNTGGDFSVSKKHSYVHWHADQGHISLWRGLNSLLLDSGYYNYWDSAQYNYYFTTAAAHNVIVINNENFKFYNSNSGYGGYDNTLSPQSEINDIGSIVSFSKLEDKYLYTKGDITKAYNDNRVNHVTRSFAFLNNKYIVVLDRISTIDANSNKKLLWHTGTEPFSNGTGWTSTPGYDDISTNSSTVHWINGISKGIYKLLYPTSNVTFRKVGGKGFEYCDLLYTQRGTGEKWDSGIWRFEVSTTSVNSDQNFLSIIQAKASSDSETNSTLIENIDQNHIGAVIDDAERKFVILFSNMEVKLASSSFSLEDSAPIGVLVCDLEEGNYKVLKDSVVLEDYQSVPVDTNGTLYFETELYGSTNIEIVKIGNSNNSAPGNPPNLIIVPKTE